MSARALPGPDVALQGVMNLRLRRWVTRGWLAGLAAGWTIACTGNDGHGPIGPPVCSSPEVCVEFTADGQGCLPACTNADAGPGGCAAGSACIYTSGCCEGAGCSATAAWVCCPLSASGTPTCGNVISIFTPDAAE